MTDAGHALVTGGAGFIGSHLVDSLLADGWRVTVIENFDPFYDRREKEANLAPHGQRAGLRLVESDLRDAEGLRRAFHDPFEVVVHLAAKAGVRPSIENPLEYQDVNVRGTHVLLELCREWRVRQFVFASSSSVYGVNPRVPWREDDHELLPISPYASTKLSGELLGHVYASLYGIRFIALRLFTVYGPRQRPDLAIRKFAELMRANLPIPVFGAGGSRRDYTYVDDVVAGIRAAMVYQETPYEVINLGNHSAVTLSQLITGLEQTLGVEARVTRLPEQPGDVLQTYADIEKARRLLAYEPSTPFDAGLAKFAVWLRSRR
ncbi:MAG TPA: NAD-dependent epimerase/dehydratase family protein [Gemmatimonadaceae bacterium]|nr:NAD-dependent epimerase/dehydratase family protein [Gemmatimonadaceae bacterium]